MAGTKKWDTELLDSLIMAGGKTQREIALIVGCSETLVWKHTHKLLEPDKVAEKYIGLEKGLLTILERIPGSRQRKPRFRCLCKCGSEAMVQSDLFMSGNTSSCGCLKRRRGENSPKYTGYREISGCYWSQIKHAAKLRKLTFDVNIQFAWELFEKQNRRCAVSGVEIVFAPTSAGMSEGTASLDQIVAGHGYVDSNVHWTHKDVNRLKWDWPIDKLIEWCDRISAFQKKKRGEDGPAGID